jgi:hypothetical protein
MALQISHQERKENWDLKTIEQNVSGKMIWWSEDLKNEQNDLKTIEQNVNKWKTVKLPVFSLTHSAFYYIILTMEKAMPDVYWILTATDGCVGTRTLCSKVFPFHNSFDFILLFLKCSPIIPKIIPHQVEPRPGENKNFIYIIGMRSWKFRRD